MTRTRGLQVIGGGALAVLFGLVALPGTFRGGVVLQGVLSGSASGLLAMGLVLTYRTSRVINLAYQAMGACAAQIAVTLHLHNDAPWAVSIGCAVVLGAVIGLAVDQVMRRFDGSSRLVATVATIGLLQVLVAVQVLVPYLLGASTFVVGFPTSLSRHSSVVGATPFFGDDLLVLLLVPVVLAGLSWFLYRTDTGVAVRGIAENGERARLLGIPARRLTRLVWVLAGVIAAAVAVLSAPRNGVPANPFVSAGGLFLPALAAAVVARMRSLPIAFTAAVGLSVFDWVVRDNVDKQAIGTVAFLAVILLALMGQRRGSSRADQADAAWTLSSARPPLPPIVSALPVVRIGRPLLVGLALATALGFPLVASASATHTYSGYVLIAVVAVSLVILSGWSGTVSVGQYAICGVGAVVAGNLIVRSNLDLVAAVLAAAAVGAAVGVLVGLPALRIQPLFLVISSLVFAASMDQFVLNPTNFTEWLPSDVVRPVLWKHYALGSETAMYFVCLALLGAAVALAVALGRGRPRRTMVATRDNPVASAALGVPTLSVRLTAMSVAGALAGAAGALTAVLENGIGTGSFPVQTGVLVFSMVVVGGIDSVGGALAGVAVTQLALALVRTLFPDVAGVASLTTGALLLGVLLLVPGGIADGMARVRDRIVFAAARRRGLRVEVGAAAGSIDPTEAVVPTETSGSPPAARDDALLRCRGVTASYGNLQVLFGVDLDVADGEMVALLGTNGAGKSTVLRTIVGLLPLNGGTIELDGHVIAGEPTEDLVRLGISMMPGGRGVFPTLTVHENLRLACWQIRRDPAATRDALQEATELFPLLGQRSGQPAGNLSGGEQQQLSLAMALTTRPRLLIIDELSLGLSPTVVAMLCDKVREVHAAGTTVILVEQSVNVALTLAERAVFLEKGAVRYHGATADLLDRPDLLRSVFIGGGDRPAEPGTPGEAHEGSTRGTELRCHGLVKRYGGITAVDHVDLTVPAGRIVGLVGHNGAGKSTLVDLISGAQEPDSGRVLLNGVDITALGAHQRAMAGLGRSFQEARLFPTLTVLDTVVVALDQRLATRSTIAAGLALPAAICAEAVARDRAAEILEELGLAGFAGTLVGDLSTGTRRLVELACVLAVEPNVLLLDEPTAGVAQRDAEAFGPLLRNLQANTGTSIVIIEHDMALLGSLCDELVAFELGAVICQGSPAEVLNHPDVIRSYLGTDESAIQRSGQRPRRTRKPILATNGAKS